MSIVLTAEGVTALNQGVWTLNMPPHQLRHFGIPPAVLTERSVLLLDKADFDERSGTLRFKLEDATTLCIGATARTVALLGRTGEQHPITAPDVLDQNELGPGDREFLSLTARDLSKEMSHAAKNLLLAVRGKSPGDLERGQNRNFSETPDNFWYVIVQPRVNQLSITIRGAVEKHQPLTRLELKPDRPGYTRFKIRGIDEVDEALKLIFNSTRKK